MSRFVLAVVTQSLQGGNHAQRPIFNHAIECTQELLEFNKYGRYESHDDPSLRYTEDAFHRLNTYNYGFLLGRAGKNEKSKANALRMELMKKRKVDEETNADSWMGSKQRRETNAWRDYISHKIDVSTELDADNNFPKIQSLSDWAEQIGGYGAFQQSFAERHKQAHKTNLKDGCNASNHNLNYLPQVITFQCRILCIEM